MLITTIGQHFLSLPGFWTHRRDRTYSSILSHTHLTLRFTTHRLPTLCVTLCNWTFGSFIKCLRTQKKHPISSAENVWIYDQVLKWSAKPTRTEFTTQLLLCSALILFAAEETCHRHHWAKFVCVGIQRISTLNDEARLPRHPPRLPIWNCSQICIRSEWLSAVIPLAD